MKSYRRNFGVTEKFLEYEKTPGYIKNCTFLGDFRFQKNELKIELVTVLQTFFCVLKGVVIFSLSGTKKMVGFTKNFLRFPPIIAKSP